jgi:hydrogenase expression/formation protein HypD
MKPMNSEEARLAQVLLSDIRERSSRPIRLMEFCGGHTVAILKNGIRQLLPPTVTLSSGPGCPVCVTATGDIDRIIQLSRYPGVITTTFGDLLRVPGSRSNLQSSRAEGSDIRIVYSALEALDLARQLPDKKVVMVGIGFETTAPTIAASILQAQNEGLKNYSVLALHKLTPPATRAILDAGEVHLDGIICPGHVSAIIGSRPYQSLPLHYGIGCVITGFEPVDILLGIDMLVRQIENNHPAVEIAYRQAVSPGGNPVALEMLDRIFRPSPASWRGFAEIPDSGYAIRPQFADFDAENIFDLPYVNLPEPAGCLCGEILRGIKLPSQCPLFEVICTPEHPVGPCMVSSEGACSAYHLYGGSNG